MFYLFLEINLFSFRRKFLIKKKEILRFGWSYTTALCRIKCQTSVYLGCRFCLFLPGNCLLARDVWNKLIREAGFQWVFPRKCGSLMVKKPLCFGLSKMVKEMSKCVVLG